MSYNKILDNDIKVIKKDILNMLDQVKQQYNRTLSVIENQDVELAKIVIDGDIIINELQNKFTATALWKIAKQQMVASDLRLAVGSILIAREIEVIGDYTKSFCDYFIKYKPDNQLMSYISSLFDLINEMLNYISRLIENYEEDLTTKVLEIETKVNEKFYELNRKIIEMINKNSTVDDTKKIVSGLMQIKNLERAGDHLISIEEIFEFIKKGKFMDPMTKIVLPNSNSEKKS